MSDYPDFGPPSGRPGYGSSYQGSGAKASNAIEQVTVLEISGRGVFLGCIIEINGPDNEVDYNLEIDIDGNIYYSNAIEDIFLLHTPPAGGPGPRMSAYIKETGHYCFTLFVVSSFTSSVTIKCDNGAGGATVFNALLYYSLVEES